MSLRILHGDCRELLRTLPDESVHCVVTSPPYFGLRDYGLAAQIGLEPTPEAYVAEMVNVFREVRRVLRNDGTCWLNLGDSFFNKQLLGIPWRVGFALQADGWWLRQDIIWAKPNPMPESVTDRCTKAHEYLFLLAKSARYHFDAAAIAEDAEARVQQRITSTAEQPKGPLRTAAGVQNGPQGGISETRNKRSVWTVATQSFSGSHFATFPPDLIEPCILAGCPAKCCAKCGAPWVREIERETTFQGGSGKAGRSAEDVNASGKWAGKQNGTNIKLGPVVSTTTLGFSPSCSCDADTVAGTVLDPFFGAGTTGLVADRLHRNCIGIELNPEYMRMGTQRIRDDAPLFVSIS